MSGNPDLEVILRLLAGRHSCRAFLPAPVPRATVDGWLRSAQRAASWCNAQPWQLLVTDAAATANFREALLAAVDHETPGPDFAFPDEYQGAYLARRREVGGQLYESVGIARGDKAGAARQMRENYRLFGAPHVAILTTERSLGVYGVLDCGVYLGTLMLAAQALGLGMIAQGAIARYPAFIRRYFGLDEDRLVACGISFGYADTAHPVNAFRTARASLDDVVTWAGE